MEQDETMKLTIYFGIKTYPVCEICGKENKENETCVTIDPDGVQGEPFYICGECWDAAE